MLPDKEIKKRHEREGERDKSIHDIASPSLSKQIKTTNE